MEAPPPPSVAPPPIPTTTPTAAHLPESIDSSPRSRHTDSWDADPPPNQLSQKLRLMCSYGGHIVPRPHDKNLCYIGGDTRIIVIDRHTSLSDLHHRLSKTLLHNQSFSLKYQIPNEDLDSLISVTTDEDLENMVDEYDRLCNNSSVGGAAKPGRLRLFLFPKTSSNIEQILVETTSTKSDDWFFNALNCKVSPLSAGASDRGFSESSSVNCLLGLDDDSAGKATAAAAAGGRDGEAQLDGSKIGGNGGGNNNAVNHDIHSLPDSPMLDTTSSFGSTSSSPSVANLPPIRVHVDETPKAAVVLVSGIEDQFQQMSVMGVAGNVNLVQMQRQEEVGGSVAAGAVVSGVPVVVSGDYSNRVFSDDERSDHSGGYRKVQQIQPQVQQVQLQSQQIPQFLHQRQQTVAFDLASPDSVSSEGSVTNPLSRQRQPIYQDSIMQMQPSNTTRVAIPTNQIDPKTGDQNNSKVQMQQQQQPQAQESGYVLSTQFDQNHPQFQQHPQQYIHAANQYIPAGAIPMTSYYPMYPSQQQHHPHQPILDPQYPFYFLPSRPNQAYTMPPMQQQQQQTSYNDYSPTNRPQTPTPTAMAAPPQTAYNQPVNPPSSKPEMAAAAAAAGVGLYRTAAGAAPPQLVQHHHQQQQPQYVGFTHMHHPSQSVAPSSAAANSNYTYEYADPNTHAQMYYNQGLTPQMVAQYQTMTSAASPSPTVVLQDASAQLPTENLKQQARTVQP
ncbi:hypothetical protein ACP275_12G074900 [Erythranthe tilingii]